jgi:hypothetical protein
MDLQRDEGDGHRLSLYWRLEHGHPFNQYDHTLNLFNSIASDIEVTSNIIQH